jgi:hypothetical protein
MVSDLAALRASTDFDLSLNASRKTWERQGVERGQEWARVHDKKRPMVEVAAVDVGRRMTYAG